MSRTVRPADASDPWASFTEKLNVDKGGGISEPWETFWINSEVDPTFQKTVALYLKDRKPKPEHVQGGLSGGKDFHLWIKTDDNHTNTNWEMGYQMAGGDWKDKVTAEITSTAWKTILLGFNNADTNAMWFVRCKP